MFGISRGPQWGVSSGNVKGGNVMLFESWEEAMEAFCQSISNEEQDMLEESGFYYDAFDGWVAANGHDWKVESYL